MKLSSAEFLRKPLWYRIVRPHIRWREDTFIIKTKYGFKMKVSFPDIIQTYIFFFGEWEPYLTTHINNTLKEGDTFIDIGGNVGYYTMLAAKLVGPSGKVLTVEASPSIFHELEHNIDMNNYSNITLFNSALSDSREDITIYKGDKQNIGGTSIIKSMKLEDSVVEEHVRSVLLTDIISEEDIKKAKIVKIDIEGMEWPVIKTIEHLFVECSDDTDFLIEVKPDAISEMGGSMEELLEIFSTAGYMAYEIQNTYAPRDYFNIDPNKKPVPFKGLDFKFKDLLFTKKDISN